MSAQKGKRAMGSKTLQALPSALLFVLVLWHELTAVSEPPCPSPFSYRRQRTVELAPYSRFY